MSKAELVRRYVLFLFGLYVNSLGIALTTRANLGTSPITSVPYVLSIRFPLSLGMFTLFFSLLLIAIQLIILGKRFPKQFLLQLPVIPIFSLFIDLSMALFWFVDPQTYPAPGLPGAGLRRVYRGGGQRGYAAGRVYGEGHLYPLEHQLR